jgi:hypothetical protein
VKHERGVLRHRASPSASSPSPPISRRFWVARPGGALGPVYLRYPYHGVGWAFCPVTLTPAPLRPALLRHAATVRVRPRAARDIDMESPTLALSTSEKQTLRYEGGVHPERGWIGSPFNGSSKPALSRNRVPVSGSRPRASARSSGF